MTLDLESQLRAYAEQVVAMSEPVDVTDVFEEPAGTEPVRVFGPRRPPRRWRRPVTVAAAAFAAVLVAVGIVVLLSLGRDVEPANPATTVVPSTSQHTPTTSPPTTAAQESPRTTVLEESTAGLWAPLSSADPSQPDTEETRDTGVAGLPGWVNEIVSDQNGVLTVNRQTASTTSVRQSDDGFEWFNPVTRPPQVFEPGTVMFDFGGGRWLAVGQYRGVEPMGIATSEDGAEWVDLRIPDDVITAGEDNPAYEACGFALGPQAAVLGETIVTLLTECRELNLVGLGIAQQGFCSWALRGSEMEIRYCDDTPPRTEVVDLDGLDLTSAERNGLANWNRDSTVVLVSESGSEFVRTGAVLDGFVLQPDGVSTIGDRFVAASWFDSTSHVFYESTDGRTWTEWPAPPGTVRMQIDSDRALAIVHNGSDSALWQWTPDAAWEQLAEFRDRLVWYVDSGASGLAAATQPPFDGSSLPEIDVGWSTDEVTWTWHTASEAFGGTPGDWRSARPAVGDGFVMALAWPSEQAVGLSAEDDPTVAQEGQLTIAQWFRFELP